VAQRGDSEFSQVCVGKLRENQEIDVILGERARVLSETQRFQPRSNIHVGSLTQIYLDGALMRW
jgi:hypothetical protein